MTGDDIEHDLRQVLVTRALEVDEHVITGESVRRHLARRRRTTVWAPLAVAAAALVLIGGVTVAVVADRGDQPTPATSSSTTTTPTRPDGSPPPCPQVTYLPNSSDSVCTIGSPPSVPPGSVLILTPGTR